MPPTTERAVRDLADAYVASLADLDPVLAIMLGLESGAQGLPDLSPAGYQAQDELARRTLATLNRLTSDAPPAPDAERRCARLLCERLETALAVSATGEQLCAVRNILGPVQGLQMMFTMMPAWPIWVWSMVFAALLPRWGVSGSRRGGPRR